MSIITLIKRIDELEQRLGNLPMTFEQRRELYRAMSKTEAKGRISHLEFTCIAIGK